MKRIEVKGYKPTEEDLKRLNGRVTVREAIARYTATIYIAVCVNDDGFVFWGDF